jgi:hypothetical protein
MALFGQMFNLGTGGGTRIEVPHSTVNRTALARGVSNTPNPRLIDRSGFIENTSLVVAGLDNFHRRTGVMPFVYVAAEIDGSRTPTRRQMADYAEIIFDRGIEQWNMNEANLLLLFFHCGCREPQDRCNCDTFILAGAQAGTPTLIDAQAIDILQGYINHYWFAGVSNSDLLNRAFTQTGERIMTVHRSPWINVLIVAVVLMILFLLFTWWKAKRDQKNLEAEQTERILNQDLQEFGDVVSDQADEHAKQYEDNEN